MKLECKDSEVWIQMDNGIIALVDKKDIDGYEEITYLELLIIAKKFIGEVKK